MSATALLVLKGLAGVSAFGIGAYAVHKLQSRGGSTNTSAANTRASKQESFAVPDRPRSQLPIRKYRQIVEDTDTQVLIDSIERKAALSKDVFDSDCRPILKAFAEYVQFLPASESHHHAQPGGLWMHALEVADTALGFRAGMELPRGRGTEDRKKLAHRWTVGVFLAALLHDLGKPMADMRVSLYGAQLHDANKWAALAGPMTSAGAFTHYSVEFVDGGEKDYQLHQKLPAILMQRFVPESVLRWLADDTELLTELLQYLSGENKDGILAEIVKRADSDSVRKNLLTGSRTRFTSARTRPLIERLMEALRRLLQEGNALPLNRAGAAGWVHDGAIWLVCGRLADELRTYLSANESLTGIPSKDKNDRIFDCFQEYGGAETNPASQGAVWRVLVECDDWKSPGVLTVLKFPLGILFDAQSAPRAMNGKITVVAQKDATAAPPSPAVASTKPQPLPPVGKALPTGLQGQAVAPASKKIEPSLAQPVSAPPPAALPETAATSSKTTSAAAPTQPPPQAQLAVTPNPEPDPHAPDEPSHTQSSDEPPPPWVDDDAPSSPPAIIEPDDLVQSSPPSMTAAVDDGDDLLEMDAAAPSDIRKLDPREPRRTEASTDLIAPIKPLEQPKNGARPRRDGTPAAKAFMRWVQLGVNSGELKYNETGALVHFVQEGCLLLSPEIFKRFVREHEGVESGEVADLIKEHGERSFTRLQNEFAKSPWSVRNGDENLHYYAFTKHAGGVSPTSSFYLIGDPGLFWRPVPEPNHRIVKTERPTKKVKPKAKE